LVYASTIIVIIHRQHQQTQATLQARPESKSKRGKKREREQRTQQQYGGGEFKFGGGRFRIQHTGARSREKNLRLQKVFRVFSFPRISNPDICIHVFMIAVLKIPKKLDSSLA
jgi:hypothetical protein